MIFGLKRKKRDGTNPRKLAKLTPVVQTRLSMFVPTPSDAVSEASGCFPSPTIRLACWSIGGLGKCMGNEVFQRFLDRPEVDVLGLTDTKLHESTVRDFKPLLAAKYPYVYFACSVDKKGYGGVAILSKVEPKTITPGMAQMEFDCEGRIITAEYEHFFLVICNTPSSGLGLGRLHYRTREWDGAFKAYMAMLATKGKGIICLGVLNVVHQDIDICEKDRHIRDVPGTTVAERNSFGKLLGDTLVDSYRRLHPTQMQFSWFRNEVEWRRNQGRRLDYALVSADYHSLVQESIIYDRVRASEHCPIEVLVANQPKPKLKPAVV